MKDTSIDAPMDLAVRREKIATLKTRLAEYRPRAPEVEYCIRLFEPNSSRLTEFDINWLEQMVLKLDQEATVPA